VTCHASVTSPTTHSRAGTPGGKEGTTTRDFGYEKQSPSCRFKRTSAVITAVGRDANMVKPRKYSRTAYSYKIIETIELISAREAVYRYGGPIELSEVEANEPLAFTLGEYGQ